MRNLLRGELYKLVRSKCFYICCMIMIGVAFLMYGLFALADLAQNSQMENITVTVDAVSVWDEMSVGTMASTLVSGFGAVIVAIFVAVFYYGDYAGGAIKNVVGKGYTRTAVFAAKFIASTVGVILMEIALFLGLIICESVFLKAERLNGTVLEVLVKYVGIQLFLSIALTALMVLMNQLSRNLGLGIAISICLVTFSSLLTMGINAVLLYLKIDVDVCEYWILDLMSNCPVEGLESGFVLRAIVCAVAWCIVSFGLGSLHFSKKDVK